MTRNVTFPPSNAVSDRTPVHLYARELDHFAPLLGFVREERAKLDRRHRLQRSTYRGILQNGCNC
jgi:hypothetical protein